MGMEITDAIRAVEMMKNHYRHFQQIEEVLTIVQQAEGRVVEANKKRMKILEETEVLRDEKVTLSVDIQHLGKDFKNRKSEASLQLKLFTEDAHSKMEALKKSYSDAKADVDMRTKKIEADLRGVILTAEKEENDLTDKISKLEASLEKLKSRVFSI